MIEPARWNRWTLAWLGLILLGGVPLARGQAPNEPSARTSLRFEPLPDFPNSLGVAGPFVGVHNDVLLVAGGANFPTPVWMNAKEWTDEIHVLTKNGDDFVWKAGGKLNTPIGYGASVSTPDGVVCIGGNDASTTFADVFLLRWDPSRQSVEQESLPSLPSPCANGQATLVGTTIYLAGGQSAAELTSAMRNFWTLDLSQKGDASAFQWRELEAWPGPSRALNITVRQHNGYDDCVYVISGRTQQGETTEFLSDVWEYTPRLQRWRQRRDAPRGVMAGTAVAVGQSHLLVLSGDDGKLYFKTDELKDEHPGFPKEAFTYHTITDTWTTLDGVPQNQVTTTAVRWGDDIVLPTGEIRPRVRTPKVWRIEIGSQHAGFGTLNYVVLVSYLLAMVGIGAFFSLKNRTTDDYFRGGKQIPWWAAGCSIFATMLSSLTFTGLPSKAYAQDWVYAIGNLMIPIVAIVAVFVALPFYRRIDATSAYEYLEIRFSRSVRLFGSASFTLFHLFRMAVVMSLTGLALAVATPLTPTQSVLVMGGLSIVYCTLGGIEAVIWTDTIQALVLLSGAVLALVLLISGSDGGLGPSFETAIAADKFRWANLHWSPTDSQIAFWVIVLGASGQHLTSYTADQAVVQRYMTTSSESMAARSIWTNAVLTIPATLLFFAIGTGLYTFYRSHPERLDPNITTDQVFPLFIASEMPVGIAGLVVAGVFSAAQSTISTSMNSTATTIVTDFFRPLGWCQSEKGALRLAQVVTFAMGVFGTLLGLFFVSPQITSLFDEFIKVVGLFMGVLGGLFVLGVLTQRANASGAMIGAVSGALVMYGLYSQTRLNGYLYIPIGILTCFVIGYLASMIVGRPKNIEGLTIFTLGADTKPASAADMPVDVAPIH